jgi:hypothetical protein
MTNFFMGESSSGDDERDANRIALSVVLQCTFGVIATKSTELQRNLLIELDCREIPLKDEHNGLSHPTPEEKLIQPFLFTTRSGEHTHILLRDFAMVAFPRLLLTVVDCRSQPAL